MRMQASRASDPSPRLFLLKLFLATRSFLRFFLQILYKAIYNLAGHRKLASHSVV